VEFHLDAIRRINDVNLALMLDAVTQLEKDFPKPVPAVFKCGFFVSVVFRVEWPAGSIRCYFRNDATLFVVMSRRARRKTAPKFALSFA
jgi:hypothetical protein